MGMHLSKTARHLAVALTLAVGAAGAVALPAWAASHGKSPAQHRTGQHAPVGTSVGTGAAVPDAAVSTKVGTGAAASGSAVSTKVGNSKAVLGRTTGTKVQDGTAVLGEAVKYVRHKDGSIHKVR
jgi:hypothetical protein